MTAGQAVRKDGKPAYAGVLDRGIRAYVLAEQAAAAVADALATKAEARFRAVESAEKELDRLDREIDATVAQAVAESTAQQARELLTTMKMVVDLERIGDLLASVANRARALGRRLEIADSGELIRMATILEAMLADAHGAFVVRNVDRALAVLRLDSEIDRLRDLLMIRHLEQSPSRTPQESVHVLFMAQSLERAGDHVKNLAEETCHLARGRTLRHSLQPAEEPEEQMYLDWLRQQPSRDGESAAHGKTAHE